MSDEMRAEFKKQIDMETFEIDGESRLVVFADTAEELMQAAYEAGRCQHCEMCSDEEMCEHISSLKPAPVTREESPAKCPLCGSNERDTRRVTGHLLDKRTPYFSQQIFCRDPWHDAPSPHAPQENKQ